MYLVAEGKRRENQLGYDMKKQEYVMYHHGVEMWREKGDVSLLDYFSDLRANYGCIDEDEIAKLSTYPIWEKYCKTCEEEEAKLWKTLQLEKHLKA